MSTQLIKYIYVMMISFISVFVAVGAPSMASAQALGRVEKVAQIKMTQLSASEGLYATVIYGAGTQSFITTSNSQINFFRIRTQSASQKIVGGQVLFPSVELKREGITVAFNLIAIVIHDQPKFGWINADGSVPQGAERGDSRFNKVLGITKVEYQQMMDAQNSPEVLLVDKN